ncbi:TlpA disulfide reductase family protein [Microbispora hainanensis]|uniref:TlpA family protein disulfide reductase n=1 Tax=Microbispora hainanensis TaxID=568844 RepID=A0A544Z1G1_9ACTN|nr:TlpA disulfide reductase family protein [Microbispora hainanensis]TQS22900.1 TlpA family protein disulfide reductase [Microbispora hainanensis]
MEILAAAVTLLGALCGVNLLLTYGLIRKMQRLSLPADAGPGLEALPKPGTQAPDFVAEGLAGEEISAERLDGSYLIGFFSVTCAPCRERLPEFTEFLSELPADTNAVIAIVGDGPDRENMIGMARRTTAHVIHEDNPSKLVESFGVNRFPTLLRVMDGYVASNATLVSQLVTASYGLRI